MQALGQLALTEALAGRLTRADAIGGEAEEIADTLTLAGDRRSGAAAAALALVRSEECDSPGARALCERATGRWTLAGDAVAGTVLALVRSRLVRARGGPDGLLDPGPAAARTPAWLEHRAQAEAASGEVARGRVTEARQLLSGAVGSGLPCVALALAAAELAQGRPDAARSALTSLLELTGVPLDVRISAWLLQASLELESGRPGAARTALDRALRLAAPERLRRPVLDAPPDVRSFLRRNRELAAAHPWLLAAGPRTGPPVRHTPPVRPRVTAGPVPTGLAPVLVLPLTEKEQEVLRLLSALFSTEEIAQTMFVSVNTVKTHVRAILRKLEVTGRNEAVRRARELELI